MSPFESTSRTALPSHTGAHMVATAEPVGRRARSTQGILLGELDADGPDLEHSCLDAGPRRLFTTQPLPEIHQRKG